MVVDSELCVCVCVCGVVVVVAGLVIRSAFISFHSFIIIDWTWGWNSGWDIHCTELQGRQLLPSQALPSFLLLAMGRGRERDYCGVAL